jgi:predicted metal-binding protein
MKKTENTEMEVGFLTVKMDKMFLSEYILLKNRIKIYGDSQSCTPSMLMNTISNLSSIWEMLIC